MNSIASVQNEATIDSQHQQTPQAKRITPKNLIRQWGVSDAAKLIGVTSNNSSMFIPVIDPGTGNKFHRRQVRGTDKALRWEGQPDHVNTPDINALPGCPSAIDAANGVLHLAKGIKEYLVLLEVGHRNVWCLTREVLGADSAARVVNLLKHHNIASVIYVPDRDEAGVHSSAVPLRDAISGTGIHLDVRQLPFDYGSKSDLFDLWDQCNQDPQSFLAAYDGLPTLDLPSIELRQKPSKTVYHGDSNDRYNDWVLTIVMPRLDAVAPIVRNKTHRHSPLRTNDENPSFYISYQIDSVKGIPFDADGAKSWNDVADAIGCQSYYQWKEDQYTTPAKPAKQRKALAQPSKRALKLTGATVVSERYMSNLANKLPKTGALCCRSDMGTGKTYHIVNNELKNKKTSLYVAPYLKPIDNFCEDANRAGIAVFHHGDVNEAADIRSFAHLATTPYQLQKLLNPETKQLRIPELLVLDEVEMVLRLYHAGHGWQTDTSNFSSFVILCYLIKHVDRVIILDAFLSDATVKFIKEFRQDVTVVENTYARSRGAKTIYSNKDRALHAAIIKHQKTGGLIAYCHNWKQDANATRELLIHHYGVPENQILIVTGDTSGSKRIREFVKDPDAFLKDNPDIKHVIYTRSLGVGFSIETEFNVMVGIYEHTPVLPLTDTGNLQMENRIRNVKSYHVWSAKGHATPRPEDANDIYQKQYNRATQTSIIADFDKHGIAILHPQQMRMLEMQSVHEAADNASINNLRHNYIANSEGHSSIAFDTQSHGVDELKTARENLVSQSADVQINGILAADPITNEAFRSLAATQEVTPEMKYGLDRFKIEALLGRSDLSKGDVQRYRKPSERKALEHLVDLLHEPLDTLKAIDRQQAGQYGRTVNKREHRTLVKSTLQTFVNTVFGNDGITPNQQFERDYIEQCADEFSAAIPDWKTRLGVRDDKSNSHLSMAKRLFKLMGLKLCSSSTTRGGKRVRLYQLDSDVYEQSIRNAQSSYNGRIAHNYENGNN